MRYDRPTTLSDALQMLSAAPRRILAGGTDLYPSAGSTLTGDVLDLTAIADLRGITRDDTGLRIGACTPWSDIVAADLPMGLTALQQAALQVGGRQIQNAGTIGGNLCNASPAADGVPPLLACNARVELSGPVGRRDMALSDFLVGPRRTALLPQEVMTAVMIPSTSLQGRSAFLKLGARAYLVISIAMVAVRIVPDAGRVGEAALAIGACSATATRLPAIEAALIGAPLRGLASRLRPADVAAALSPIDDIRAPATYRAEAAAELLSRAVAEVAS